MSTCMEFLFTNGIEGEIVRRGRNFIVTKATHALKRNEFNLPEC